MDNIKATKSVEDQNAPVQPVATAVTGTPRPLGMLGICCILLGVWFLADPSSGGSSVVNLQMLGIGIVLSISGAIFVAAQWRPR